VEGTREEKLEKVRQIRDAIQARVEQFCAENDIRLTELGRTLRPPQ
jgi:lipopolysaccharide/colanic/teichoic acid biosynthesis glycosyltransferase